MKKSIIVLFICLIFNQMLFSKETDKDWRKMRKENITTTTTKGLFGKKKTTTKVDTYFEDIGLSSLSVGGFIGFPQLAVAARYRDSDNKKRYMASIGLDYSNSLAINKISPSIDLEFNFEYVKGFNIKIKDDYKKLFYLDVGPTVGFGFYTPLDNPKKPSDYYALFANIGVIASADLPYKDLPITCFFRICYRPTIPFVRNHFILKNRIGIDIGCTYNIKEFKGGTVYNDKKMENIAQNDKKDDKINPVKTDKKKRK